MKCKDGLQYSHILYHLQFSQDSAYPKKNPYPNEVQLMSCDADNYVLIWALRKYASGNWDTTSPHSSSVTR